MAIPSWLFYDPSSHKQKSKKTLLFHLHASKNNETIQQILKRSTAGAPFKAIRVAKCIPWRRRRRSLRLNACLTLPHLAQNHQLQAKLRVVYDSIVYGERGFSIPHTSHWARLLVSSCLTRRNNVTKISDSSVWRRRRLEKFMPQQNEIS